jgi:hypothetical protein
VRSAHRPCGIDSAPGKPRLSAHNVEAERQACEIRLRAERRCGVLLAEREKAKGAIEPGTNRGSTPSHAATASKPLADLGISRTQSSRWQKLAAVPEPAISRARTLRLRLIFDRATGQIGPPRIVTILDYIPPDLGFSKLRYKV